MNSEEIARARTSPRVARAQRNYAGFRPAHLLFRLFFFAALSSQSACSLLVETQSTPKRENSEAVPPLTAGEKLWYLFDNLGEVSPGLAYRTGEPGMGVLQFLARRVDLGHILNFKKTFLFRHISCHP